MSTSTPLPSTTRAVVCNDYAQPLSLTSVPLAPPTSGTALVRILAAAVEHNIKSMLSSPRTFFSNPPPFIPGCHAVARVVAVGPDATTLSPGQLVLLEPFTRGRDNADAQVLRGLFGGPDPASQKLSTEENWKNGFWAEYVRVPLENAYLLNEAVLCGSKQDGGLGYTVEELVHLSTMLVPYGSFRAVGLTAGETVVVAPATGNFSGAAVEVASAMGARVVAVGRNKESLKSLEEKVPRVQGVTLEGEEVQQHVAAMRKAGPVDVFMDFTPAHMKESVWLNAGLAALRPYGRAVLTGFAQGNFSASYALMVFKSLTIRGQYMYQREDVLSMIKMVENGVLKIGKDAGFEVAGPFSLDEFEKALDVASQNPGWGKEVIIKP